MTYNPAASLVTVSVTIQTDEFAPVTTVKVVLLLAVPFITRVSAAKRVVNNTTDVKVILTVFVAVLFTVPVTCVAESMVAIVDAAPTPFPPIDIPTIRPAVEVSPEMILFPLVVVPVWFVSEAVS